MKKTDIAMAVGDPPQVLFDGAGRIKIVGLVTAGQSPIVSFRPDMSDPFPWDAMPENPITLQLPVKLWVQNLAPFPQTLRVWSWV